MDIELFIYDCRCMVIDQFTFALTSGELNKLSLDVTYMWLWIHVIEYDSPSPP